MSFRLIALSLVGFALVIGAIMLAGKAPSDVLFQVIKGSLGSPRAIAGTLKEATPLLVGGLGVFIALRAGLFNIGIEGQILVGALVAAVVGLRFPGPAGIVLAIVFGCLSGALVALPAAVIRVYRGGHEVITTIMMNNIVKLFSAALVAGPFKSALVQDPRTASLTPNTMLPAVYSNGPLQIFPSLLIGIVMIVAFSFWMKRSVGGFELNAVGANRIAATFAGIDAKRVMMRAFLSSGALGGFAGALMVLAHEGCFYDGFSPGYGFDSLGVALLSGGTPIGLLPAGLAFGLLNQGQSALSILGISKGLTSVLLGCLIVVLAAYRYRPVKVVANG